MWISGPDLVGTINPPHPPQAQGDFGVFESSASPGNIYMLLADYTLGGMRLWSANALDGAEWATIGDRITHRRLAIAFNPSLDTIVYTCSEWSDSTRTHVVLINVNTGAQTDLDVTSVITTAFSSPIATLLDNGDLILMWTPIPGANQWAKYSGGAWSAPGSLTDHGLILEVNQHANVCYTIYSASGVKMQALNADGSLGAVGTVRVGSYSREAYGKISTYADGELFIALGSAGVYRGSTLQTPVFVQSTSQGNTTNQVDSGASGVFQIWKYQVTNDDTPYSVLSDSMMVSRYLGSDAWSDPVVGVDFIEHPAVLPPLAGNVYSHWVTNKILHDGTFAFGGAFDDTELTSTMFYAHYNLEAEPAPAPLTLDCNDPPNGKVNVEYSHDLSITGGTPPYTVGDVSGLPPGLTMDSDGHIHGIPIVAGTFTFSATVIDSGGA